VFDVKSKPQADSAAYTAVNLPPHSDLPTREWQPGVQFLHCLVNDATGGESVFVDGFAIGEPMALRLFQVMTRDERFYIERRLKPGDMWPSTTAACCMRAAPSTRPPARGICRAPMSTATRSTRAGGC